MGLPSKNEILQRAKAKAMEQQVRAGLPDISPTERELKESGTFQEARLDLMRVDQEALSQQMGYLQQMAGEMRFKVIPLSELATLHRKTGYEYTNGWTKHKRKPSTVRKKVLSPAPTKKLKSIRRPILKREKAKPKKRQKNHSARSGKTMRALRHVKGVKVFSFPDSIWKVHKPRKRRRRK